VHGLKLLAVVRIQGTSTSLSATIVHTCFDKNRVWTLQGTLPVTSQVMFG